MSEELLKTYDEILQECDMMSVPDDNHTVEAHALERIREEAVKWVKNFRDRKNCPACEEADNYVTCWENEPVLEDVSSIIAVFKHFFNLTDEDLK